jgi:hypothetical protein
MVLHRADGLSTPFGRSGQAFTVIAVAVVAAYLPARRAARVEPMRGLRRE